MNIGDRVRLIHSKEEGIITKLMKDNVVEVEIEDGFKLLILKRELTIISSSEKQYFGKKSSEIDEVKPLVKPTTVKAEKGIFLAFERKNEKEIAIYVINNTDFDLPFSLTTSTEKTNRGLLGGFLKAKSFQKSPIELLIKDFDEWGSFHFQAFYYTFGFFIEKNPLSKKMRLRANTFFNQTKKAPLLEKDTFLFQLDAEAQTLVINTDELKTQMFEQKQPIIEQKIIEKPNSMIDLHIENLTKDFLTLNNADILGIQLNFFEQKLEQGIATGLDEMIFIHGVGNGVLRNEIQKRLSNHKNVAWFQDAQKEKFGYGATKIKIK
jgi:hypothetical protein